MNETEIIQRLAKLPRRPFAVFDVDGTICQSSLLEAEIEALLAAGIMKREVFAQALAVKDRWKRVNTEGTYTAYLDMLVTAFVRAIAGVPVTELQVVTEHVVREQTVRQFAFPKLLINRLRNSHTLIGISGSPQFLVEPYLESLGVTVVFGSTYEVKNGLYTGEATSVPAKAKILRDLVIAGVVDETHSIALGDTMSDKDMLRLADRGIMFNPSRTLLDYGREFGLAMVLEHKDRISCFGLDNGRYSEQTLDSILGS